MKRTVVYILGGLLLLGLTRQSCPARQGSSGTAVKPVPGTPQDTASARQAPGGRQKVVPLMYEKSKQHTDSLKNRKLLPARRKSRAVQDLSVEKPKRKRHSSHYKKASER